ncbi:MAG TPA: serine/threonine-protein kinase, partial [Thermoanaerobaculia bacterium]|nr:serine/threonine-protein kinase [Thermoanaerobaculia bacterium]
MIADRWRRVDELFAAALELADGEERRRLLDARCAGDGDLRAEVERLLAADRAADGFLETPPFAALQAALQAARARPAPGDLAPGTAVGRYRVIDKIGEGGMGAVYAAHDPELGRTVALKLVHPDEASGASRDRLLREAQALARVSHPHVVTVHDVGRHGEAVFLAMEYVAGGTLDDWLRAGPRGWREVVAAFLPAAHGLAAAHAAGIVHRDFKPSNVLRGDDGRTRVADFGLARAAPERATVLPLVAPPRRATAVPPASDGAGEPAAPVPFPAGRWLASRLTVTGRALGTPSFMAPEQHAGGEVGPATDQFAFCVALWQALYGEHPFAGGSPAETRARVLAGEVAPAPSGARVPAWLRAVLLRGLEVRPERRWGSLAELAQTIERRTAPRRAPLALGVALAIAVAALAAWA